MLMLTSFPKKERTVQYPRKEVTKMTQTQEEKDRGKESEQHPIFHYTVDDEPQTTTQHVLTPRQILTNAGLNPETNYLVQIIENHHPKSYKDTPDKEIHMHQHMDFISVFTGDTPIMGVPE